MLQVNIFFCEVNIKTNCNIDYKACIVIIIPIKNVSFVVFLRWYSCYFLVPPYFFITFNLNFTSNLTQKPYKLDRNGKGGGIILNVREDLPSKLINTSWTNHDKEYFFRELNLRKQKSLIICNYYPHKAKIKGYFECISKEIDSHSSKYDNFLLLGDFNSKPAEEAIKSFCLKFSKTH